MAQPLLDWRNDSNFEEAGRTVVTTKWSIGVGIPLEPTHNIFIVSTRCRALECRSSPWHAGVSEAGSASKVLRSCSRSIRSGLPQRRAGIFIFATREITVEPPFFRLSPHLAKRPLSVPQHRNTLHFASLSSPHAPDFSRDLYRNGE